MTDRELLAKTLYYMNDSNDNFENMKEFYLYKADIIIQKLSDIPIQTIIRVIKEI
jgi:hypothetical protein